MVRLKIRARISILAVFLVLVTSFVEVLGFKEMDQNQTAATRPGDLLATDDKINDNGLSDLVGHV